jgi:exodeoxyribonuclease V alpha subunit
MHMSHDAMLAMLAEGVTRRVLRSLDLAFARFIAECDPSAEPALLLLAALASRQLGDGHPCLDLQALDVLAEEQEWPASWLELLSTAPMPVSRLLAQTDGLPEQAPLVLDRHRLYLRRYWNYECRVAEGITTRLSENLLPAVALHDELQRLFPAQSADDIQWPRVACALAARGAFSVITGGPGTGKTTTVVRLLGLLQTLHLREHDAPLRIRLAAPTGKAAARLNASIARQIALLDVQEHVRAAIPLEVETLHRLLGARPDSRRYAYDHRRPLHLDVLVIDEASMIDLEMMAAVLDALPPQARLILIGDKDQLASVEAGAVLGELGRRAEHGNYDTATVVWVRHATGDDLSPFVRDEAQPLDQHVAMLRSSHRFDAASGIGRLASAVNAGDAATVNALLSAASSDIVWISSGITDVTWAIDGYADRFAAREPGDQPQGFRCYLEHLQQHRPALNADDAHYRRWGHDVLEAFKRFQVLCAVRQGPAGIERLNRDIAAVLLAAGLIETDRGWYEGRPVMVPRNDYSLGLMNGDVGMTLRMRGADGERRLYAVFPVARGVSSSLPQDDDAQVRCVSPSRLGDVETVYAMTVHKSQGSEFEHTALVLPDDAPAILTRELLYTGITRARRWLSVIGAPASIEQALAQRTRRYSGLGERLVMKSNAT